MEITVGMGEIKIARPPDLLVAIGLGSCVAVALYDNKTKTGGLAHVVLPCIGEAHDKSHPLKFTDVAIDKMLGLMKNYGAGIDNLKAKIFGGANMFPEIIRSSSSMDIGKRNVQATRNELDKNHITIEAEEVGDHMGRTVLIDPEDGSVVVKTARVEVRKY